MGLKERCAGAETLTQFLHRTGQQPGMAGGIQLKVLLDLLPAGLGNLSGSFWLTPVVPIKVNQFINRVIKGDMLLVKKEAPPSRCSVKAITENMATTQHRINVIS